MKLTVEELESRILFEGDGLLAVNKCPDLPTSGRALDDEDCLQFALMERRGAMVWAVHQLDADTSGVNLFTTEKELVEPLKRAMAAPDAEKEYVAIVHGSPAWESRRSVEPIGLVAPGELGVTEAGRSAESSFEVQGRLPGFARVRARITTGRTHQIRIHLASLGHPLVGEEWYRRPPCRLHPRQALHAERLQLAGTFARELRAPTPTDLNELWQLLNRQHGV